MKSSEARITWPLKSSGVITDQKLIFGVQVLFFTYYSVEFLHFGQVNQISSSLTINFQLLPLSTLIDIFVKS